MATSKTRLSAEELAALDVIIAAKREDPKLLNELSFLPFTTPAILAAARITLRLTPAITRLTAQTIDLIGPIDKAGPQADTLKKLQQAGGGKGLSVDDLVKIRQDAAGGGKTAG